MRIVRCVVLLSLLLASPLHADGRLQPVVQGKDRTQIVMLSAELTQRWISKLSDALYRVVNVPNFSIVLAPDQSGRLNLLDSTSGKINKRFWFDFGLQILDGPTERLSEIALSEHGTAGIVGNNLEQDNGSYGWWRETKPCIHGWPRVSLR